MNITSKSIYKLKYFKNIDGFFEVKGGKSGAKTFCVTSNSRKYFVKFRKWCTPYQKKNFKFFSKYVNTPKIYKSGKVDGIQYYIAEYIGDKAKQISKMPQDEIYNLAKYIGAKQLNMSQNMTVSKKIKNKVYKTFVLDGEVVTVDFEESYYNYLPFMCRACAYELMLQDTICNEERYFTKGVVDAFYKGNVPPKFDRLFVAVLYRAISQYFITRIDKPDKLKKYAHNLSLNFSRVNSLRELFNFDIDSF